MPGEARVFLGTSVLFAAVLSERGGARMILKLAEAGAVAPWVGPGVLREAEAVLAEKSPQSRPYFALLLDLAQVQVGPEAGSDALAQARSAIDHPGDAQIMAEALTVGVDYLVSLGRKHLVGNARRRELPLLVGSPGEFLAWYRARLANSGPQARHRAA